MQLVLPSVAAPRGATTDRGPIRPLPVDLDAWRHAVVVADLPAARVRVHAIVEAETAAGWPCTLVRSDLLDDAGAVIARRLHGLYRLIDRGCVVTVTGADADAVDAARADLLAADVDWRSDELVALAQLWEPA
ncbi:MAG: hypothetical protein H6709_25060 [Kofleriaceae bacterium]|nr:hypothetical protein [Myxococcales bacterium]MCB9565523.1 hypothetical protein [Kofleriaceae bacterium]MCB9575360.1 hypothetical protein [Kofleriaceae bacterium]